MQKWEYGYMYVITATNRSVGGSDQGFIVVEGARGSRVLENVSDQLVALNFPGDLGWIISDSPYNRNWGLQFNGWLYDLAKKEKPDTYSVVIHYVHFMRRPLSLS